MTPERLTEIRERVEYLTGALPENRNGQDSADLLAEVDRLRAGVEALIPVLEAADLLRDRVEVALTNPTLTPEETS